MNKGINNIEKMAFGIIDIAGMASVSRGMVFNQIKIGNLKTFLCGRRRLATRQAIEEWIEKLSAN